jgi:hypothetical protein
MSLLATLIRPFWLPGLHSVSGRAVSGLGEWFTSRPYQAYHPLQPSSTSSRVDRFVLSIAESSLLLHAYASDCSRLGTASFETIHSINRIHGLPRSTAWLLVKCYYSSYFAAHAILKMLGVSCSYIDGGQSAVINEVIDVYGMANGFRVPSETFRCSYDPRNQELICTRQTNERGGSHQFLWTTFHDEMRRLSTKILSMSGVREDQQEVSAKIDELCDALCSNGNASGGWLSSVRNKVNYQQDFGAWFPYTGVTTADKLFDIRTLWSKDALTISLTSKSSGDPARFLGTCAFIISLARIMILDMSERHPENKSFYKYGSIAFLNLLHR